MPIVKLILVIAGVIFLVLAGLNISGPRFNPGWLGLACLAAALFLPAPIGSGS